MKSDIEIAHETNLLPITEVAANFGINTEYLELYGNYKAKFDDGIYDQLKHKTNGKLILVTAINPTPAGEGKTTTTIGLAQALNKLGKKTIVALREPSLGPCMGTKGGATGGGYSQIVPMEDINLHFTGDIHAITTANNILSAMIDNHIHHGNKLRIDPRRITWKRALDMNDRALRNIVVGLGGKANGFPREDGFQITVASEIMAILCLSEDMADLKIRLKKIVIGYDYDDKPVTANDLKADGAMAALLKDAIKPNLVQTLEHTPAIVHGGPFANIAHGCNSVRATKLAMKLGDITVTEAGFGADLGAEKFFDIKCRQAGITPNAVVIVATVRALKYNGGVRKDQLQTENVAAVKAGFVNLKKHIENLQQYGLPIVVALNSFYSDTDAEKTYIKDACNALGIDIAVSEIFLSGGNGGIELAKKVLNAIDGNKAAFKLLYPEDASIKEKIDSVCKKIYGAGSISYTAVANKQIDDANKLNMAHFPVCIAKTQYSFSDNPALLGCPSGFNITVREVKISAGAGFLVVLTGDIMTMPGLSAIPAAEKIDITNSGEILGLF